MVLWSHGEVQVCVSLHLHAQGPSYPFSCACCRQNCKEQVVFSSPPTINCLTDVDIVLCLIMWRQEEVCQTDVNVWSPALGCFSAARILPDFLIFTQSLVLAGAFVSV